MLARHILYDAFNNKYWTAAVVGAWVWGGGVIPPPFSRLRGFSPTGLTLLSGTHKRCQLPPRFFGPIHQKIRQVAEKIGCPDRTLPIGVGNRQFVIFYFKILMDIYLEREIIQNTSSSAFYNPAADFSVPMIYSAVISASRHHWISQAPTLPQGLCCLDIYFPHVPGPWKLFHRTKE